MAGRERLAALAVTLAPVLYFLPALLSGSALCPDDGTIFNTPLRVVAANITRSGSLPLWNPYIFGGMPLFASAQGGLLFPLNWFYLLFEPRAATNLMVVTSYMLAALGAYLYARRAGASVAGAFVTSLAWQWGGFLIGQIGHIGVVQVGACLPWVLWALDGYALTGRRKWGVGLAAFVALQALVGHQQTLAYSLLLAAIYAAAGAYTQRAGRARYLWSLAFLAVGVLLAAVQILPTFELLRNSLRADSSYDFFTSFSLPPQMLETFLAPYVAGGGDGRLFRAPYVGPPFYGELAGYVGALGLMLAACAVVFRRDARTKFWAAAALVCLTLALGRYAPLELYKLVYYVPVLNLFRVPARHLMEAEFALAVLAGRGLTALAAARGEAFARWRALAVACVFALLTFAAVTLGRPGEFKLARQAPVSFMRAPELFVPVLVAGLSAWALWAFARGRRGATALLLAVLVCDLALWGQASGWRQASPGADAQLWREPEPVKIIRAHGAAAAPASYRILTAPHPFDPARAPVPPSVSHSTDWTLWTQPDIYMMYGVPNAAGYDGFGLARYSRLAGEMKVWGELTDPDASLRGDGREIDLLGVRYLVSMRPKSVNVSVRDDGRTPDAQASTTPALDYPNATQRYGDFLFAGNDLGLPNLGAGRTLRFTVAPVEADRISLVTNLSWSEKVPDGTSVGRLRLMTQDGRTFDFALRAGADSSEWAHDRADIHARIRHQRANVAASYPVSDSAGQYEGHTYVASFALPERAVVTGGEVFAEVTPKWPDLLLSVFRVSLADAAAGRTYPLRREWFTVERQQAAAAASAAAAAKSQTTLAKGATEKVGKTVESDAAGASSAGRWKLLGETAWESVYENTHALPRAWLARDVRPLDEEEALKVIRTGLLPDGSKWEPESTVLVEPDSGTKLDTPAETGGGAEVTRYEPNRVDLKTKSSGPAVLVLAENHYPGWRAYLDGEAVGVLRVNYNQRGVLVPAGEHALSFVYRPKSVIIGGALSLLTAALLVLWWRGLLPEAWLLGLVAHVRRGREQNEGVGV